VSKVKKVGRKATEAIRSQARELVDLYKLAETSPDQRHCVNPGDAPEERDYLDFNDPRLLLSALECFANHGHFNDPFAKSVFQLVVRSEFDDLRSQDKTYGCSVEALSTRHARSTSGIERLVKQPQTVTKADGD